MTYSSSLFRNSSLALPSKIADSEFPEKEKMEDLQIILEMFV